MSAAEGPWLLVMSVAGGPPLYYTGTPHTRNPDPWSGDPRQGRRFYRRRAQATARLFNRQLQFAPGLDQRLWAVPLDEALPAAREIWN
jgi:hypothetical protein